MLGGAGASDRLVEGSAAQGATPWLNHLADEINAALDRLQDGLLRVESSGQRCREEGVDLGLGVVQPLRRQSK